MEFDPLNKLGGAILDSVITVHKELGPGLLESAYELALLQELSLRRIKAKRQVVRELFYKGACLEKAYIIDLLVENEIIVEIKAVDTLLPIHKAQLLTHLRLSDLRLGYLINFNVPLLKEGFKRIVNKLSEFN